jgi:hypothetical protein
LHNTLFAYKIKHALKINNSKIGATQMAEIKFEITKHIGVLSEGAKGWRKELNLVSWNEREPKYDIRDWAPEHEKMGKGVTLNAEEAEALKKLLTDLEA